MQLFWNNLFNEQKRISLDELKKIFIKLGIKPEFKTINVVGTNGKGSVSFYLAQSMQKKYKVGHFTSPHLLKPNERIKVNGKEISDDDVVRINKMINQPMHFFSKMFLIAIIFFIEQDVDWAIIEAGIGGAHDTTSILEGTIGVVTSIGKDHVEILGNTLKKIAVDKAGIINNKMHFYIPSSIKRTLRKKFKGAEKTYVVDNNSKDFMTQNKKLASFILKNEFKIIQNDFKNLPGRVDIKRKNGFNKIYDVAHNKAGLTSLFNFLEKNNVTYDKVVISIQKKKNIKGINKILPKNKEIFFYKPNDNFHSFKGIKQIKDLKKLKGNILYTGSFLFIGAIYE